MTTQKEKEKRIVKIDASLLSSSACTLKQWLKTYKGYHSRLPNSASLVFGSAVHIFAEWFHKGAGDEMGIAKAKSRALKYYADTDKYLDKKTNHLDAQFLLTVCDAYMAWCVKGENVRDYKIIVEDGIPLVESKFAIPYYEDEDLSILLCGTLDQIESFDDKLFLISDIKTTQSHDQKKFLRGFGLSLQLRIYRLAVQYHAEKFPDSIFSRITKGTIGCRIKGIFVSAGNTPEIVTSDISYYKDEDLKEVEDMVKIQVMKLVGYIKSDSRPLKEGILTGECQSFSGCEYCGACMAPGDRAMFGVLDSNFQKKEYDPLTFR